jgi:hypothetical protein
MGSFRKKRENQIKEMKKLSEEDRLRILANYLIDIIYEDYKKGKLRFSDKLVTIK